MNNDFDRLLFFENSRREAEESYSQNPYDSDNLCKWGGALLELWQFQNVPDSKKMVSEAMSKLEEALLVNPKHTEALWVLGNANTSVGFLHPEVEDASVYFDRATSCFQQAADEDPANELYRKSIELASKAPELHTEIHKNASLQQAMASGPSTSTSTKLSAKKKKSSDLTYGICGWIILAVGIVAWVGFAKSQVPPPPSRWALAFLQPRTHLVEDAFDGLGAFWCPVHS